MPTPQQKIKVLASAYRALTDPEWGPRSVKGLLPPLDSSVYEQLSALNAAELIDASVNFDGSSILVSEVNLNSHKGKIFQIELVTSHGPTIPFVKTLQGLLDLSATLTRKPSGFFIADINYCSEDEGDPPEIISKYFSVLSFIQILQRLSDFADRTDPDALTLVFLLKEKYEVRVEYGADGVEKASQSTTLLHFIESSPHEANKRDILKGVVVDVIRSSREPFTTLIQSLDEVTRRATDNYAVFVSEFSFDKIRDEIEKRKSEFVLRINKVFSDIQDKLLGVPLALIIASTQMSKTSGYGKNCAIMCGISIFTILMALLIKNQVSNLIAIKDEYCYQEDLLEREYGSLHEKIAAAFATIQKRWDYLNVVFNCITILVLVNYIFAYVLYYKWTWQFRETLNAILYLVSTFNCWA